MFAVLVVHAGHEFPPAAFQNILESARYNCNALKPQSILE